MGIEQVSDVIQTNSATAEQSAAASEELSSQALMLKNMVDKFRLKSNDYKSYGETSLGNMRNKSYDKNKSLGYGEAINVKPIISLGEMDFGKY